MLGRHEGPPVTRAAHQAWAESSEQRQGVRLKHVNDTSKIISLYLEGEGRGGERLLRRRTV